MGQVKSGGRSIEEARPFIFRSLKDVFLLAGEWDHGTRHFRGNRLSVRSSEITKRHGADLCHLCQRD
jgi:hypothetical protein